jgi:hypothetical protein
LLLTHDQLSTQHHHNTTPRQTRAPTPAAPGNPAHPLIMVPAPASVPAPAPPPAPAIASALALSPPNPFDGQHTAGTPTLPPISAHPNAPFPGMNHPFIPHEVQPFSPPPLRPTTPALGNGNTPFNHLTRNLFSPFFSTASSQTSSHRPPLHGGDLITNEPPLKTRTLALRPTWNS